MMRSKLAGPIFSVRPAPKKNDMLILRDDAGDAYIRAIDQNGNIREPVLSFSVDFADLKLQHRDEMVQ